jgi:hypothetical protein
MVLQSSVLKSHEGLSFAALTSIPVWYLRVPSFRESVFRAVVLREGVPVADILPLWLDVSSHPAHGEVQAEEVRRPCSRFRREIVQAIGRCRGTRRPSPRPCIRECRRS